jgi:hypothetical protein
MTSSLQNRGLKRSDIGFHSIRKGAATYCSSGATACPSSTAIHLRTGWALGGVQDRYMRYEKAGDMHIGRTVCGLPTDSADFAILPPYFNSMRSDREEESKTEEEDLVSDKEDSGYEYEVDNIILQEDDPLIDDTIEMLF